MPNREPRGWTPQTAQQHVLSPLRAPAPTAALAPFTGLSMKLPVSRESITAAAVAATNCILAVFSRRRGPPRDASRQPTAQPRPKKQRTTQEDGYGSDLDGPAFDEEQPSQSTSPSTPALHHQPHGVQNQHPALQRLPQPPPLQPMQRPARGMVTSKPRHSTLGGTVEVALWRATGGWPTQVIVIHMHRPSAADRNPDRNPSSFLTQVTPSSTHVPSPTLTATPAPSTRLWICCSLCVGSSSCTRGVLASVGCAAACHPSSP